MSTSFGGKRASVHRLHVLTTFNWHVQESSKGKHWNQTLQTALLESNDHSSLLDVINQLRCRGVSSNVPLPQLLICNELSASKSSVLAAISGVRFSTRDTLCTWLATELALRSARQTYVSVSITLEEDRSPDDKLALSEFNFAESDLRLLKQSRKRKM